MRRYLVAGNWKMHGSRQMTTELINAIKQQITGKTVEVVLCPAAPYLAQAGELLKDSDIKLGAQTVSAFEQGAHTGETALSMLDDLGCQYAVIGHSERRELYAETNQQIADKFAACAKTNITPILCVGETLSDRQAQQTEDVINAQLDAVLQTAGIKAFSQAVIAYEPVWAIGTGETATPMQAQQVHAFIRNKLAQLDANIADKIQILYGGSVKADNADKLFEQTDIDGGLIGGAALKAQDFIAVCQAAENLANNQN